MNWVSRDIYRRYNAVAGFSPETVHNRAKAREAALQLGNAPGAALTLTCDVVKQNEDVQAGLVLLAAAGAIKEDLTPGGVPLYYWEAEKA
ncbi:hypothetical protein vBAmaSR9Y2_46 [Alteromonas phage vB_AmaS-R9Y2]|nr:hypothetical protein vBAmaSR9Y2_46 [Alteromonas phage vB_AmaS-R9Y2]